jgi:hypothetical protein
MLGLRTSHSERIPMPVRELITAATDHGTYVLWDRAGPIGAGRGILGGIAPRRRPPSVWQRTSREHRGSVYVRVSHLSYEQRAALENPPARRMTVRGQGAADLWKLPMRGTTAVDPSPIGLTWIHAEDHHRMILRVGCKDCGITPSDAPDQFEWSWTGPKGQQVRAYSPVCKSCSR